MQEAKELTIVLKDEEKRMTHKFLIYEDLSVSYQDDTIRKCINEAKKSFDGQPDSIVIKIKLVVE